MKKISLIFVLLLASLLIKAQIKKEIVADDEQNIKIQVPKIVKKDDIRSLIFKSIWTQRFTDSLAAIPKDEAHMLSVAVSFNKMGEVDTVYFSAKMTPRLKDFFVPINELKSAISKRISISKVYKDVVILFPVLFHYRDHNMIKKGILIDDFINLWPRLSKEDDLKKLVLLEPYNVWTVKYI
ncbi:hypothetical protein [Pedobacter sp. UYP24]